MNCIKMDIEGAELEILHKATFPKRIRCLVFEYSYSADPRMSRFRAVIRRLRQCFTNVEFPPSALKRPVGKDGVEIRYSNRDVLVHCWGRK